MKKTFFLLIAIAAYSIAGAQCSIDQNNINQGISPAPSQFPCIERGIATTAAHTMQVYVPATLELPIQIPLPVGITINYVDISNIGGLPSGISYACNPNDCNFIGGIPGCIRLNGTTNDPTGSYELNIDGTLCLSIPLLGDTCIPLALLNQLLGNLPIQLPLPIPSFSYAVDVIEAGASCDRSTGFGNQPELQMECSVFPNPAKGSFTLKMVSEKSFSGTLSLINAMGQIVMVKDIRSNGVFQEQFSTENLNSGLYAVRLNNAEGSLTRSLMVR